MKSRFESELSRRAFIERQAVIVARVTGVPASPATFESNSDPRKRTFHLMKEADAFVTEHEGRGA